jgi:putative ABC transport system permease protein
MSIATRVRAVLARLRGFHHAPDVEARLSEEIRFHLDMQTARNVERGMTPDAARRAALVRFGGVENHKEGARDEYRARPVEEAILDLRYAVRAFRRAPAFTSTIILTLAIGIGANTAIFSAIDGVLLKPLPFADADRLMAIQQHDGKKGIDTDVAPGNFIDWTKRSQSFASFGAAEPYSVTLMTPDGPEMVRNWNVTERFFDALGVRPALGRFFDPSDFRDNAAPVVVVSYESWQRRFGGDRGVIGQRLQVNGSVATVVGVIPRGAMFPAGREFLSPKVLGELERESRSSGFWPAIARLRPGVTREAAIAEMTTIAAQLAREYPRTNADLGITITPISDSIVGGLRRTLWLFAGAVGLLLLVACANVANLLLAQTLRRGRELAIRAALGAGRRRVLRQLLVESVLLSTLGAMAGVLVARWGIAAIRALAPTNLPRIDAVQVDVRALAFAIVVAFVTAAIFGLIPALRAASTDPQDELRSTGRAATATREHRRARNAIVAAEVALSVVLLTGAGLLVRSFVSLLNVDRGFHAERVVTATMFTWQWNRGPERLVGFGNALADATRAIPGVQAAAISTAVPLSEPIGPTEASFTIDGRAGDPARDARSAFVTVASPELFDVLQVPVLRGRRFERSDDATRTPVVVINQTLASRFFPGEDPIGKRVHVRYAGPPIVREIVGVVADLRQRSLEQPAPPAMFIPFAQAPTGSIMLVARAAGGVDIIPEIRAAVKTLNPELPIARTTTLESLTNDALRFRRFVLLLLVSFAMSALSLAVVGVYGLIAQNAVERTGEIGVRIALGANRASVLRLMMRQTLTPALVGVLIGLVASANVTHLLRGMLYAVSPLDVVTFVAVPLVILVLAATASFIPALRAAKVDPLRALRSS